MGSELVSPELRAELDLHIELRARDNIRAGMDPRAAWADARRRFGDVEAIAARCTGRGRRDPRHTLRAVGLTCLLGLVLAVMNAMQAAARSGISDATLLAGLAALSVLTLALAVVGCCLTFSMARSTR